MRALTKLLGYVFASIALFSASIAQACIVPATDQANADILDAERIFVGELIDYEIVSDGDYPRDTELAVLTYRVDQALKGEFDNEIRLFWVNSTFGYPDEVFTFSREIVGVEPPSEDYASPLGWLKRPSHNTIRGYPRMHEIMCGGRTALPASMANIAELSRWIAAGEASDYELTFDGVELIPFDARRTGQVDFTYIVLGIALLVIIGGGMAAYRRD